MFAPDYFDPGYFAPQYFPPGFSVVAPKVVVAPTVSGGAAARSSISQYDSIHDRIKRIEQDDQEIFETIQLLIASRIIH